MISLVLKLQPYPYIHQDKQYDGIIYKFPDKCSKCSRCECFTYSDKLSTCSNGVSYLWFSHDGYIIFGVIEDSPTLSNAQKKAQKTVHKYSLRKITPYINALNCLMLDSGLKGKLNTPKIIQAGQDDSVQHNSLPNPALFHEFKSLLATIIRNINVIVENRSNDVSSFDEKIAGEEFHNERAIYHASRLLEGKLAAFDFIASRHKIDDRQYCTKFRFHGLLHKYIQIYKSNFSTKEIKLENDHHSDQHLFANADAISVIIQNFIDNAYKYAPSKSTIKIYSKDEREKLIFSVISYGPKINSTERIFFEGYREATAKRLTNDGLGFGLYISKVIADTLKITLNVKQDSKPTSHNGMHHTDFTMIIPIALFAWEE